MKFSFRPPTVDDAQMILDWRTTPEITRFMFTDIEYDIERQRRWLLACESRQDFVHFIMSVDGRPLGYLSYAQIDRTNLHCTPGIYQKLQPSERHIAGYTNDFVLDYAFYKLGMNKLVYYVMDGNGNFIKSFAKMKVRSVGVLRDHVFKYGRFHDVHIFERSRAEWEGARHLFSRETTLAAFEQPGSGPSS